MNIIIKSLFIFFYLTITSLSQSLSNKRATQFINAIINDCDSLENFSYPEELQISKRLGITYTGIKNKFLISYEIPVQIIEEIKNKKVDYNVNIEQIDDDYSILHFEVKQKNYKTSYYFKNNYLISPPYFFYKEWEKIESGHFIFYISDPEYFNQYSVYRLEDFISDIFSVLNYTKDETQQLKEEKIIYILCKDEVEIEKLTGYKARGMFNLAYDYIITTFNCHYHELLHLLINYKSKDLPLYTHPFLQEGFAVAFGGRGGKEPEVIQNLGYFIAESNFFNYKELLSSDDFRNFDVSMSYPMSGLYNDFIISRLGIDNYLKLYLKYSADDINGLTITLDDLLRESEWLKFINERTHYRQIKVDFDEEEFQILHEDSSYILKEDSELYLIKTDGNILISTPEKEENYYSKIFQEFYPKNKYNGERYLIRINDSEIAVYNLYTNNLIANYVSGFTLDMKPVPKENDLYTFCINKKIFDEFPNEWSIKILENK